MRRRSNLEVERLDHEDARLVVFRLAGKLTGTKDCYAFLEGVRDDIHEGRSHVVLNLEKVERVTSPGIGILAACYTSATKAGGRLSVVAVPKTVRMLLEVVCLWDLLDHCSTEVEAIKLATG